MDWLYSDIYIYIFDKENIVGWHLDKAMKH